MIILRLWNIQVKIIFSAKIDYKKNANDPKVKTHLINKHNCTTKIELANFLAFFEVIFNIFGLIAFMPSICTKFIIPSKFNTSK